LPKLDIDCPTEIRNDVQDDPIMPVASLSRRRLWDIRRRIAYLPGYWHVATEGDGPAITWRTVSTDLDALTSHDNWSMSSA